MGEQHGTRALPNRKGSQQMRYFARLRYENGFQHEVPIAGASMKAAVKHAIQLAKNRPADRNKVVRVQVVKYK